MRRGLFNKLCKYVVHDSRQNQGPDDDDDDNDATQKRCDIMLNPVRIHDCGPVEQEMRAMGASSCVIGQLVKLFMHSGRLILCQWSWMYLLFFSLLLLLLFSSSCTDTNTDLYRKRTHYYH